MAIAGRSPGGRPLRRRREKDVDAGYRRLRGDRTPSTTGSAARPTALNGPFASQYTKSVLWVRSRLLRGQYWCHAPASGERLLQARLDLTSIEQFDRKVGKCRPYSLNEIGKSFSADSGICVGTAIRPGFCETSDKRIGIATIPCIVVASCNLGGLHCFRFLRLRIRFSRGV